MPRTLRLRPNLTLLTALPFLGACSDQGAAAARDVVVRFCTAVAAGEFDAARALLIATERRDQARQLAQQGLEGGYDVGPAQLADGRAKVEVTTKAAPKPVTFVLVLEDRVWRINLALSMNATLGDPLEHARRVIDQAGKQMVERFEQTKKDAQNPTTPR